MWLSRLLSGRTPSAFLGFTGGWAIGWLCTQTLFLPPSQPLSSGLTLLCPSPPVQPRPLHLLTCLPTHGSMAGSEPSSVCPVPPGNKSSIPLPFYRGEAEAGTITFHSYLVAEVGFQLRNPVIGLQRLCVSTRPGPQTVGGDFSLGLGYLGPQLFVRRTAAPSVDRG